MYHPRDWGGVVADLPLFHTIARWYDERGRHLRYRAVYEAKWDALRGGFTKRMAQAMDEAL